VCFSLSDHLGSLPRQDCREARKDREKKGHEAHEERGKEERCHHGTKGFVAIEFFFFFLYYFAFLSSSSFS
jgi:hypothetical protein